MGTRFFPIREVSRSTQPEDFSSMASYQEKHMHECSPCGEDSNQSRFEKTCAFIWVASGHDFSHLLTALWIRHNREHLILSLLICCNTVLESFWMWQCLHVYHFRRVATFLPSLGDPFALSGVDFRPIPFSMYVFPTHGDGLCFLWYVCGIHRTSGLGSIGLVWFHHGSRFVLFGWCTIPIRRRWGCWEEGHQRTQGTTTGWKDDVATMEPPVDETSAWKNLQCGFGGSKRSDGHPSRLRKDVRATSWIRHAVNATRGFAHPVPWGSLDTGRIHA